MALPESLEGQVARYADRIAYINHDIDDALRAGVLHAGDLPEETSRVLGVSSSQRIDTMVTSLLEASAGADQIGMGAQVFDVLLETRDFLFERVYNRPEVKEEQDRARKILTSLLEHYRDHPEDLPQDVREAAGSEGEVAAIDYIAGMTDRFAIRDFERW